MSHPSTISQRLAGFFADLRYDDLPPEVIDKAKAVLLHGLLVGLISLDDPDVAVARRIALTDGPLPGGARLLGFGDRVSRTSAALVGSTLVHARSQDDSYRMLTHPGCVVIPAALAEADGRAIDGRRFLTALVSGYELAGRLARDVIPSVQNHGFRSSALFAIFGPTAVAAKLRGLAADQFAHALALAVSVAGGTLETGRAGSREMTYQEPIIAQAGLTAVALAEAGATGAATCFEGAAGFYYAFTGSAEGALTGSFHGEVRAELGEITADLGRRWEILGVTMKIYSSAGYTQPVIEAVGRLAREHDLRPAGVQAITIAMNSWETVFPSPRFPKSKGGPTDQHSTAYLAAQALADQGYAVTGRRLGYGEGDPVQEAAEVRDLAARVTILAADRRQYAPKITITRTDGRVLETEMTGDEFKWDLATERERCQALYPALPFTQQRIDDLVEAISRVDALSNVDQLIELTLRG